MTSEECPRSFVSPQSVAWIEEFHAWRVGRLRELLPLPSKTAEAFAVLEGETERARNHDERGDS